MHTLIQYRAGYRSEYFERLELGEYSASNPIIQSLVFNGLVKVSKAGAITPDRLLIKAVLQNYETPEEYRGKLENGWMFFKKATE